MFLKFATSIRLLAAALTFAAAPVSHAFESSAKPTAPSGNALHMKRLVETTIKDAFRQMVFQNQIALFSSENYKISFWARASKPIKFRVTTKNSAEPWAFFGLREEFKLTTKWKRYEFTFLADEPVPGETRLTFNYGDIDAADIWIADLSMNQVLPKDSSGKPKFGENLITNPQFLQGKEKWLAEGVGEGLFLYDVQTMAEVEAANPKK